MSFQSLAPSGSTPDTAPSATTSSAPGGGFTADDWSAVLFPLGFSFVVGFAIGYAARQFLRISLVTAGVLLFGLFGLEYAGLIDVNWTEMEAHYQAAVDWLGAQTEGFREFVTGRLPSVGSSAAGLYVGFRRR